MGDVSVHVQFGKEKFSMDVPPDAKVEYIMQVVERETGVPQRSQKLIYKGMRLPRCKYSI